MAMNQTPVFGGIPQNEWDVAAGVPLTTGNTAKDGTGATQTLFTGVAVDGSFVEKIIARSVGTNVASLLRIFLNNGLASTTPANNKLIKEINLPVTTLSEVSAQPEVDVILNMRLAPGYKLLCCVATTVAAGWQVTALGSRYTQV